MSGQVETDQVAATLKAEGKRGVLALQTLERLRVTADERLTKIERRLEQMDRLERKLDLLLSNRPATSRLHLPQQSSDKGIDTGKQPAAAPASSKLQRMAPKMSKERAGWLGGVMEVLTPKSANKSTSHGEPQSLDA